MNRGEGGTEKETDSIQRKRGHGSCLGSGRDPLPWYPERVPSAPLLPPGRELPAARVGTGDGELGDELEGVGWAAGWRFWEAEGWGLWASRNQRWREGVGPGGRLRPLVRFRPPTPHLMLAKEVLQVWGPLSVPVPVSQTKLESSLPGS